MLAAAAPPPAHHHHATTPLHVRVVSVPPPKTDPLPDVTGAVPLRDAKKLPSTTDQYKALRQEIDKNKPAAESAKRSRETDALDLGRHFVSPSLKRPTGDLILSL